MATQVKPLSALLVDGTPCPDGWDVTAIVNEDNLSYLISHSGAKEALVVDPMREDWDTLVAEAAKLSGYRFIAVMDTHTHADHVSCAARLAGHLGAPFLMCDRSPSAKPQLRVSDKTTLPSQAAPLRFFCTPGHTSDGLTVFWGPFLLAGDTILYGDTGRDDLPGGDAAAHFESLEKIKAAATGDMIFLTNHDGRARASSWATQLKVNPSLSQNREDFVREASAYTGPTPKNLEESLRENTR